MKQVSHAEALMAALEATGQEDDKELEALLVSQLSHSDGIRGFMVTYLTSEESPADKLTVPVPLQKAMAQVDAIQLVPLACMNVVMPTAMISMHQNPNLSARSRTTAQRGSRILEHLLQNRIRTASKNCKAILAVATGQATSIDASDFYSDLIKVSTFDAVLFLSLP
jgi:hypothetical protein